MPERTAAYDYWFPADKLFTQLVHVVKSTPDANDLEWNANQLTAKWQVGKGWFSASFLTAESADIEIRMQPIGPLNTRMYVTVSSRALLDFEDFLPVALQQIADALANVLAYIRNEPYRPLFLSYRHDDTEDVVGRIYDHFSLYFGAANVFRDTHSIPAGHDFVSAIDALLSQTRLVIPVIGKRWLGTADADAASDYVYFEIASALAKRLPMLPVLVSGAEMPRLQDLKPLLQPLARVNAFRLRPDPYFAHDIVELMAHIEQLI